MRNRPFSLPMTRVFLLGCAILFISANASADPIFSYSPIVEPILSATFNADFAALVAHPSFFGFQVNMVTLMGTTGATVDLTDAFFGTAAFPDTPKINMGPLQTSVVSAPIPSSFFSSLQTGAVGYWLLFTDSDDGLFAIDYISLRITTSIRTIEAFLDSNSGFGIGIPDGGNLPSPLLSSIPIGATGTGFDEAISSKSLHAEVPEPATWQFVVCGVALIVLIRWRS